MYEEGSHRPESPDVPPQGLPTQASIPDPLFEVRALKRRVQLGVYGGIAALVPFYVFVLPLSVFEFVAVFGFSLLIALTAI